MKSLQSFVFLAAILLTAAPFSAQPGQVVGYGDPGWALAECPPEIESVRQEYAQAVRSAREGKAVYTPHPYPSSREQVLENYLDYLRRASDWKGPSVNMESVRDDYRRVLTGVAESKVTFEIQRVEQWRESLRCSTHRPREFYYIVRVFEQSKETTRGIVLDSGLVVGNDLGDEAGLTPLIKLDVARSLLKERFGIDGVSEMQYVDSFAAPGYGFCDTTSPCIAARSGAAVLLLESDLALHWDKPRRLLQIDLRGRQESFTNEITNLRGVERNEALWNSVAVEAGERWVSIGGHSQTAWMVEPLN